MESAFGFIGFLVMLCSRSLVCAQCSTCLEGKCHDTGECILGCEAGYFDIFCDKICPLYCLNASCYTDRSTRVITCYNGCVDGYCGSTCLSVCPTGCVTCDRQCNTCNVTQCPKGRYGAGCRQTCDPNYEKCDRESGKCIRCRRGYYGDNCNQKCTTCFTKAQDVEFNCQSGCDRCRSQGCQSGYYGRTCNYPCSEHCNSHRCKQTTGKCSAGCQSGYYGRTCNYACSELCLSHICNQWTGTCEYGSKFPGHRKIMNDEDTFDILPLVLLSVGIPSVFLVCVVAVAAVMFAVVRLCRRCGHMLGPIKRHSTEIGDDDRELTNIAISGKIPGHNSKILGDQLMTLLEEENKPASPGVCM